MPHRTTYRSTRRQSFDQGSRGPRYLQRIRSGQRFLAGFLLAPPTPPPSIRDPRPSSPFSGLPLTMPPPLPPLPPSPPEARKTRLPTVRVVACPPPPPPAASAIEVESLHAKRSAAATARASGEDGEASTSLPRPTERSRLDNSLQTQILACVFLRERYQHAFRWVTRSRG